MWPMRRAPTVHWYLKEWLKAKNRTGVWLEEKTNWTKRINNQLINNKIRWNADHLHLVSNILHVEPYELLIHPDVAAEMMQLKAEALGNNRLSAVPEKKSSDVRNNSNSLKSGTDD